MAGSEEYLASLGFDTSDVDKAVNQTITLLGHLGTQFDGLGKHTEKAERALLGVAKATKAATDGATSQTNKSKAQAEAMFKVREAAYNQAQTFARVNEAYAKAAEGQQRLAFSSPALRYALYDVSSTATIASVAITALGTASVVAAAKQESAFANVERTLDTMDPAKIEEVRQSLLQLSREIPQSFGDIAGIATLGNQLGVAADDVDEFTGTIARFSTVSGVSAEETAKVFGGLTSILGISSAEFENLGSAITLVGRKSAATDAEILSLTKEIGQQATAAGFAASDVVALSGALGQLRVPPERSRGALTTYFQTLNAAVAEGGDKLENFATVIGVTSAELESMVRSGQGTEIFQRFVNSLQQFDNVDITSALDQLGLSQLRVSDTFQRLASDAGTFNTYLGLSANAYAEGTELARQYAIVVETLASKWQLFLNALAEFGAAVGSAIGPAVAWLLDVTTQVIVALAQFADTPIGNGLTIIAAAVGALAAALLGLIGMAAAAGATIAAFRFALQQIGVEAALASGGIRGLALSMLGLEVGATRAAIGWRILRLAMISTGIGALIVAVGFLVGLLVDFGGTMNMIRQPIHFVIDALANLARMALFAGRTIAQALSSVPLIGGAYKGLASASDNALNSISNFAREATHAGFDRWVDSLQDATPAMDDLGDAGGYAGGELGSLGSVPGTLDDIGDSAGEAAKEVRTLVDYASDLRQVFSRSFELRFGASGSSDDIASAWNAIKQAVADTNAQIKEYQATMQSLSADKAIRQYWLKVAQNYGDALRAGELRAEIAEIDNKLEKTSKDLSAAQEKNSQSLEGNSEAAIGNREELENLIQKYMEHVAVLAASGMSQADLQRATEALRAEFIRQGTQLGYSRTDLNKYAKAFDDVSVAIAKVPKNVTVTFNPNPALQAIAELKSKATTAASSIQKALGGALSGGAGGLANNTNQITENFKRMARLMRLQAMLGEYTGQAVAAAAKGNGPGAAMYSLLAKGVQGLIQSGSYRKGTDWTGSGNPWEIAGVVHNREAVLNASATQTVGSQFVNAANQGRNPWQYAPQSSGKVKFPSTITVELSPVDREIMANGKPVTVVIGGDDLSRTTSHYDEDDNRRGGA